MVEVPIDTSCSAALPNSTRPDGACELRNAKSDKRSYSCNKCWERKSKLLMAIYIVIFACVVVTIGIRVMCTREYLRIAWSAGSSSSDESAKIAVDAAELTEATARFKREISRETRDCRLNAKRCEALLQSVQNYLEISNNQFSDVGSAFMFKDFLKCVNCANLEMTTARLDAESTPRPDTERYLTHDPAEHDLARDSVKSDVKLIKLLDDDGGESGSRPAAATSAGNHEGGRRSEVTKSAKIGKIQSGENAPVTPNVGGYSAAESNAAKSSIVMLPQFTTAASSSIETSLEYETSLASRNVTPSEVIASTEADSTESSETITRKNADDDRTEQTASVEIATNAATRFDVTGIGSSIDGAARPTRPPLEEHRRGQATANVSEPSSTADHRALSGVEGIDGDFRDSVNRTTDSPKQTEGNAKTHQELTPETSWTIPRPVCFYGPAEQFLSKQSPLNLIFPDPSVSQQGTPPSEVPSGSRRGSPLPNYVPRFNYIGRLAQARPAEPDLGILAGSAVPVFSLNQPPIASSSLPGEQSYMCTYVSLPTSLDLPPASGFASSSRDRTSNETEKPPAAESPKSAEGAVDWLYNPTHTKTCPPDSRQCANGGRCVLKAKWCDGRADCTDASDETKCSCRDRISRDRLCDGYFDCPQGEDELGCFDCPENSFSCDDWEQRHSRDNCVPLEQRCDGIEQCRNGRDELDCTILSAWYIEKDLFTIGYLEGYIFKNVRGQWYPACSTVLSWALDACASETGRPVESVPHVLAVQQRENMFPGPYVQKSGDKIAIVDSCANSGIFVRCPQLMCGTRVLPHHSLPVATTRQRYVYKRQAEERLPSDIARFGKFYRETLELLDGRDPKSVREQQNRNDTPIESQLRVVGGRASHPRAWPFLVAVYKDGDFHCGGVIIDEARIITAAHCMEEFQTHYYEVQAGVLRRFSFSPMAQSRLAVAVMMHNDYRSGDMQSDIALVVLNEPFRFNRWIRQICLPTESSAGPNWDRGPTPESTCVAIGWGATREYGPDPDHLREVEVPILPRCKYPVDNTERSICAGYPQGGRDACQGDSGGPLMCRNPNLESQWYVAGIISHGDGCGRADEPGVYTKVSYFVPWIQQMSENSSIQFSHENRPSLNCPGFMCETGLERCLSAKKICDGVVDCLDAEDETNCSSQTGAMRHSQSNNKLSNSTFRKDSADEVSNVTREYQTSTEADPVSTPVSRETKMQSSNVVGSHTPGANATTSKTAPSVKSTFTCTSLIQTITIDKRCDGRLDCEDGTDESGCACRDYLLNLRPAAICDGHLDCEDQTDEKDCDVCAESEFLCGGGGSGTCVSSQSRCDGVFDCPTMEDEMDCFALTNGEYLSEDKDNRSALNVEGLLSRYVRGKWHLECVKLKRNYHLTMLNIGRNVCAYLGFGDVQSVDKIAVGRTELETRSWWRRDNVTSHVATSAGDGTCLTLGIRCRPVLSSSIDDHLVVDARTGSRAYLWPWLAAIFVDGRYHCSALLLEPDWLLSDSRCTKDIRLSVNYTTALLGQSRSYLYVDGPYQQVSAVDEITNVKDTNVSLLHLKTAANLTRHVLPLFLEKKIYPPAKDDLCVAVGTNEAHVTWSIFLQPIVEGCSRCHRCFVKSPSSECPANATSLDWSGTVFCHGERGWYPAAVFNETHRLCDSRSMQRLTSIDYINAYITQTLDKTPLPVTEPECNGTRCSLGQCVPRSRVCDGVRDCRDGADESAAACKGIQQIRSNDVDRKCARSELRCENGKCMPKNTYCDGKVDCPDGTDEPVGCTCAEYLKLTAPGLLCDGVRHCFDKTDESPEVCNCTETAFKCDTKGQNHTCVPRDFLCDNDKDCPNGEDEKQCVKMEKLAQDKPDTGEVMQLSYGVWHSLCFPSLTTAEEEARAACRKMGYANGTVSDKIRTVDRPVVPSFDDFFMIRLNRETWITMRNDKPLVTLARPEVPCYRLVVKCAQ